MDICGEELQIIYRHYKPYCIRDKGGLLFMFKDISKYQEQEERYRAELKQQQQLAEFLLDSLKSRHGKANNKNPLNNRG